MVFLRYCWLHNDFGSSIFRHVQSKSLYNNIMLIGVYNVPYQSVYLKEKWGDNISEIFSLMIHIICTVQYLLGKYT
jgi:hypothetical protein